MPLQNRVDPFGNLFAARVRGTLMGNRGGRFHRDDRTLGRRRHVTQAWICCRLTFKQRRRAIWGGGYTELFFLDEPTALAAGHRPCFECRREDAESFRSLFMRAHRLSSPPRAAEIDRLVHRQRRGPPAKRRPFFPLDEIPDGAFVRIGGAELLAVRGTHLLVWTPGGYRECHPRPSGAVAEVLTPRSILAVLAAGYRPLWHASAGEIPSPFGRSL